MTDLMALAWLVLGWLPAPTAVQPTAPLSSPGQGTRTTPVASIVADSLACAGASVTLDGRGSTGTDSLRFSWALTVRPAGSRAGVARADSAVATLVPDVAGDYEISLQVSDSTGTHAASSALLAFSSRITEDIVADTVFTAVCPTYHVDRLLRVEAKMEVRPGVTLQFTSGQNRRLVVAEAGSLRAVGTEERPVRFLGEATAGSWEGLEIRSSSEENELSHVEVAYGGRAGAYHNVRVNNGARLRITNSALRESGQHGLYLDRSAELSGFAANTFRSNAGAGVYLSAEQMGRLDGASRYAGGNGIDAIVVEGGTVDSDQTWPRTDAPFRVRGIVRVQADVVVEAGAQLVFEAGQNRRLIVNDPGSLRAVGTAADPIRFVSDPGAPGSWEGLEIRSASPQNRLTHVEVAFGGRAGSSHNVLVRGALTVTDSVIRDSGTWGIYVANRSARLTESGNTFSGNAQGDVRTP